MEPQRAPFLLLPLLVAQVACTTVYVPLSESPTEASLAEAMQILQETDDRVVLLEDGIQLEVYFYEWRRLPPPLGLALHERLLDDSMFPEDQQARFLTGPRRDVYLPYASIRAVEARSWPMWSGVELEVAGANGEGLDGPLVIRANDAEEAERLSDAIDRARRARLPVAAESGEATQPAD
jgi:hypothetical protein